MGGIAKAVWVAAAGVLVQSMGVGAVTLTIDEATQYQTIDGFGACCDRMAQWTVRQGPFYVDVPYDGQWDTIAGDLGMSGIRLLVAGDFASSIPAQTIEHVTELHARGIDLFWTSILSPPAYMKSNNDEANGGTLLPEYYDDFAAMVVQYCNTFKTATGVDLWGISLQNELAFVEPYASCVYTAQTYKALVRVVVPAMRSAGLATKLLGAEHMLWGFPQYESPITNDTATDDYLDRFILHSYLNDVDPIPADQAVQNWTNAGAFSTQKNTGLWMSETSGYDTTWDGALELASYMYVTLRYGKATGWMYLNISTWNGTENCLLRPYGYSPLGVVSKHFYRFIRPGMVMIDCTDDPTNSVFAVALRNEALSQYTVVVLNTGAAAQSVTLSGGSLPASLNVYQSTESTVCELIGTSSGTVSCPARSVTTLSTPATVGTLQPARAAVRRDGVAGGVRAARVYTLDGRLARTSERSGGMGTGVFVTINPAGAPRRTVGSTTD